MLPLVYYNYSQVGGNDLQNLVKKCNGLNLPEITTVPTALSSSFATTAPVTTVSVIDDDFTIDIKNEEQKDEIERYKEIKSLKDQNKELEVEVMMRNKRNNLIWTKWSKKRGDKTNYELFNEALEASRSSTPGSSTPGSSTSVGRLTIPSGFKLPGAPEPSESKIDYSLYKTMVRVGVPPDSVATKMSADLNITKDAADEIIKDGFPTPTESISSAAAEQSGPSTTVPARPALLASITGATLKRNETIAKPTVEDFLISEGVDNFNREEYIIYVREIVSKQPMMRELTFRQYDNLIGNSKSNWDKLFTDKGLKVVLSPKKLETKYSRIHEILEKNGNKYKPLSGGHYIISYSV